jgi:RecB family exonuclease
VPPILLRSPAAHLRIARAREWLSEHGPADEILVVAASSDAANDLLRGAATEKGAAFGWHRATLGRLAAALATPALVDQERAPIGAFATEAVVARVLHELQEAGFLGRYTEVAAGPGFSLRGIHEAYDRELVRAGLGDRATVFRLAGEAVRNRGLRHPLLDLPTLLLDVPVESPVECGFVEALAARAPNLLATLPAGDGVSLAHLRKALGVEPALVDSEGSASSLRRLQDHLFEEAAPPESALDEGVVVLSAPGESRECVEIARRILRCAARGVPFDRMAVLLRSAEEYRPHLEEALGRAGIPGHFARGAVRPDPAGRALLALLTCAAEGLSARRFAEYLSLGQVPDATAAGEPPAPAPAGDRWVAPDEELVPEAVAEALGSAARPREGRFLPGDAEAVAPAESAHPAPGAKRATEPATCDPEVAPVTAGTLRVPHRWERLLVDADLEELDDPDDPAADRLRRSLDDLASLRAYALPLLDTLAGLPQRATWGVWLDALSALASRALRHPERVLGVLSELAPMAPVGSVDLDEVGLVLSKRLLEVALPTPRIRYGRVFVAPAELARGLSFEAVFVPGLAEKLFPRKIAEEPILLDAARQRLDAGLVTNQDRVERERLALRLAVGAASRQVVLSFPRLDLDQSRPRVPSFYALEALRAAEGRLPGFGELAARAEKLGEARVGWPAPPHPHDAIDEAEHDLALLETLLGLDPEKSVGTARYLLTANPHLGRALRFRARRWLRSWTVADGLVKPSPAGGEAIRVHALAARSYSPTALQQYAACPYRFFLYAVHRLSPRERPEAIEELDPLQRGSLVHDVQFLFFEQLREEKLLPVNWKNLEQAYALLDEVLDEVAARYRDELAPAIERVWVDGVASVRADLREWVRRMSEDESGFVPWRFELSFGLPGRRARDPHSSADPVALDCGLRLRGSIDLVERTREGHLRVTDHKTGKARVKSGDVVSGGASLQPVLYALAAEKLFPGSQVDSGRLYYCTASGGFEDREVPIDEVAHRSAARVAEIIGESLSKAFLPAAPAKRACEWCDYRVVCGPYEELRTGRKSQSELAPLETLRRLR